MSVHPNANIAKTDDDILPQTQTKSTQNALESTADTRAQKAESTKATPAETQTQKSLFDTDPQAQKAESTHDTKKRAKQILACRQSRKIYTTKPRSKQAHFKAF